MSARALDAKRLARKVLALPNDGLRTVEGYDSMQQLQAALTRLLQDVYHSLPAGVYEAVEKLRQSRRGRPRKYAGTGACDTPEQTWTEMRAAYANGESLRSLAKRYGVLYSAVANKANDRDDPWASTTYRGSGSSPCCGSRMKCVGRTGCGPGAHIDLYECVRCRNVWREEWQLGRGRTPLEPENAKVIQLRGYPRPA